MAVKLRAKPLDGKPVRVINTLHPLLPTLIETTAKVTEHLPNSRELTDDVLLITEDGSAITVTGGEVRLLLLRLENNEPLELEKAIFPSSLLPKDAEEAT